MSVPLILPANGKRVGEIVGSVAYLPVTSKNYLAVAKGYSVDEQVLRTIEAAGAETIDFFHKKTARHFRVKVRAFREHAQRFDFGLGGKWAAPMECYETAGETDHVSH